MLDDLLGRTELKERIDELEEELQRAERQLEAEQQRRTEAASARQDAEERINRLEDRIADLEGRLEGDDGDTDLAFRHTESAEISRCRGVLDRVESVRTEAESALTAVVTDRHDIPTAVEEVLGDRAALAARAAPCIVVADDAGLVSAALSPPVVPDAIETWDDRFAIDREWFLPTGEFALALVRADTFALGEYRGTERVSFTGFETDVKGDHSKGGFSQARFERLRDEQIADHLDRCRGALADCDFDRRYVVGDGRLVDEFEDATATAAVDATGDPEPALDDAFRSFWTTRVYGL